MNDIAPPQDIEILRILREQDGASTAVTLIDGRTLTVYDIAWGYDTGETFAHVTTNISPGAAGQPIDVFTTDQVASIIDPTTGDVLFRSTPR